MPVNQRMTPTWARYTPADVLTNDPAWRVTAPTDGGGARIAAACWRHLDSRCCPGPPGGGFAGIGGADRCFGEPHSALLPRWRRGVPPRWQVAVLLVVALSAVPGRRGCWSGNSVSGSWVSARLALRSGRYRWRAVGFVPQSVRAMVIPSLRLERGAFRWRWSAWHG